MKSEMEVKVDVLARENAVLQEERKRLKAEMRDCTATFERAIKAMQSENNKVKE
jgi:hypothetical protein